MSERPAADWQKRPLLFERPEARKKEQEAGAASSGAVELESPSWRTTFEEFPETIGIDVDLRTLNAPGASDMSKIKQSLPTQIQFEGGKVIAVLFTGGLIFTHRKGITIESAIL